MESYAGLVDLIRSWDAANPQFKHGRHRYSLNDYGLTEAQIEIRFRDYIAVL